MPSRQEVIRVRFRGQVQAGDKSGSCWHVACWSTVGMGAIKQGESSGHGASFITGGFLTLNDR